MLRRQQEEIAPVTSDVAHEVAELQRAPKEPYFGLSSLRQRERAMYEVIHLADSQLKIFLLGLRPVAMQSPVMAPLTARAANQAAALDPSAPVTQMANAAPTSAVLQPLVAHAART